MLEESVIQIHRDINKPIAEAVGLPNKLYTGEQGFVDDRNTVMAPNWACIGFIEDLPEANFVFPVDFMGLPLLITRDTSDDIRVFHTVCSHRGMHLADQACRTNGLVRCPYHSWTYQLDGKLRGTPHIGGFGIHEHAEFDKEASNLKQIRSEIWLGCVFVNLSGSAVDFKTYVEPLTRQFDELCSIDQRERFTSGTQGCRTQLTVKSNWKLAVENYLESYHLPTVHPELNRISPLQEHFCLEYFDQGAGQGSLNYQRLNIDEKELPTLDGWPTVQQNKALYPTLYPNTLIGLHADHLFIMMLQPTASDETVEHVRISYVGSEALDQKYANHHQQMLDNWSGVFGEDIFAVERMQKRTIVPWVCRWQVCPSNGRTYGAFSQMDSTVPFRWHAKPQILSHAIP